MITGRTRLCAILADPITHVRTPETFNALMADRRLDAVLVPLHVTAGNLAAVIDGLRGVANLAGLVVTVPHKTAMPALCDTISADARLAGAVNIVRREPDGRLHGDILDGKGFVAGLRQNGVDPAGRRVFLAGAGGAASAIALALVEAGAGRLGIYNRTGERARNLADRLYASGSNTEIYATDNSPAGYDIVINATSLGLGADDPLPFATAQLTPRQIVAEIIMKPEWTPLLLEAKARGCHIVKGAPMLDCQLALMADHMGLTA